MSLQNVDVHTNCYCYDKGFSIVDFKQFPHNDSNSFDLHAQEILFLIKGSIHISTGWQHERTLTEGEFVYLPAGATVYYTAITDCETLSMRFTDEVPECHIFQISKIAERIEDKYEGIYALKVNDRMQMFLSGLLSTFSDGLRCRQYLQLEVARMLYLLHAYYPQTDCMKFFAPILSPDVKFSEFVRTSWMKFGTIKEFADGIFMTTQQFSNRFKKIFGTTPHDWITNQKAQRIYQDICRSDMPLKEISEKYNFSSQSNFFHFCKNAFGNTPGQIRKSLKYDLVEV
jgi:AraC-like DNA-binding protein